MPKNDEWLRLCGCTIQDTRKSNAVAPAMVAEAGRRMA
jgi:hypothetical protein